ncbi:MAG: ABC transporter ATP-binding protein [Spirochaetes bacterium]|nr:ABC transporter ATP-binding protein [Spirochaetota bacterium]
MKKEMKPPAICFNGVTKIYRIPSILPWQAAKKIDALINATFSCSPGEITCLLGPNGAGKTTVIKILAGLVSHDGGDIALKGGPRGGAERDAVKIGVMASNDRSFYWRLTGRQNLEFFSALYGFNRSTIRDMVGEILSELAITAEADKPFRLYSTGTRQKFLLARALLGNPGILLLDEPTSHIDPIAKSGIHALIRENIVRKRNTTILLCTHDLYEVHELADSIILLHGGRVIAQGTPARLRSMIRPGITFTINFSRMPRRNWAVRLPVTIIREERGSVECAAVNRRAIPAAVRAAVAGGGEVTGCAERDESIVELFARLAGGDA